MNIHIPRHMNAITWLLDDHIEAGRGDKIVLCCGHEEYTYRQILNKVAALSRALIDYQVSIGDRVLLLMKDSPEFVIAYFSAMRIGAVPVPVNTFFMEKDLMYILNDSRAKVLIADEDLADFAKMRSGELPHLNYTILTEKKRPYAARISLPEIFAAYEGEWLDPVAVTSDDMAYWLYSSGTTGFPKAVVHLHKNILYCDLYGKGVLGITEEDRVFSSSKNFFAYALGNTIHIPFKNGASTILMKEHPSIDNIETIFRTRKPTLFFSSPSFYRRILRHPNHIEGIDMLRNCISTGEPLPIDTYVQWKEKYGHAILEGLGLTEFTYTVISNSPADNSMGSTGKKVPGIETKIVNDEGGACAPLEVGTLMVKAPHMASCYWNQHQKSKEAFIGEWMDTGDCFYEDEEGYFYYIGRKDDMIKSSGIMVYPIEVEHVINEHPLVEESAVMKVAEHVDGAVKIAACVKLIPGAEQSDTIKEELLAFSHRKLPAYKCPKEILFVEQLPKTFTGKLQRYKLADSKKV